MCTSLMNAIFAVLCALFALNVNSQIAERPPFSCEGRPSGYYADISSGCQIYHMCDGLGRQFSYSCPNTTLFQQRMLICDHWYMVNCSKAELDYGANLLIGQRGKPFVEDDAEHPYHRTPRPDLLAHPSAAEYNIIYRTGRAQQGNHKNLVGADSDYEENASPITDPPAYFLPSHWSTEYSGATSTERSVKVKSKVEAKKSYYPGKNDVVVNFKSNFKATTPVYPRTVTPEVPLLDEEVIHNELNTILQPPLTKDTQQTFGLPRTERPVVNFQSNFKATTPVYPKTVTPEEPLAFEEKPLATSNNGAYGVASIIEPPRNPDENFKAQEPTAKVNFQSNFPATTPVYPKYVTPETPLAIQEPVVNPNQVSLSTVIQPPKSFTETKTNTIREPSMYYQPPGKRFTTTTSRPTRDKWEELRRLFLIPDYEFPLDASARRPGYGEGPSSFQVNPFSYDLMPRRHA